MPRIVDHDQRRAELGRVALDLVRREGVAALSVRNLARESGWSVGAVRHYLTSQHETVELACTQVRDAFERRLLAVPQEGDPVSWLRAALRAALPLDEESRELSQVWLAFLGSEVHRGEAERDQGMGAVVYDELADLFERSFEGFDEAGVLRGCSPRQATVTLQAVFDGLTVHLLLGRISHDEALASLDRVLDGLLDGWPAAPALGDGPAAPAR